MTGKQAYREFLKSAFWKKLSLEKKRQVGHCERCLKTKRLQSHHLHYPKDWYDTQLKDLEVLCRRCHAREHGKPIEQNLSFMIYRDDWQFSAILHRCRCLINKMIAGRGLRPRDESFLDWAEKAYPPQRGDSCLSWHVGQVREWNAGFKAGKYC